jgi:26S proteasome regulatory subunit N7
MLLYIKEGAVAEQKLALEKTPGLGSRIDIVLTLIRLGFFFGDNGLITENLPKAERCAITKLYRKFELTSFRFIEEGGDWDRRNRLKVYRGLHMISIRQLKAGGALLLDALSTFTATELTTYNEFVALTIIINALTLKRVDLKKRVCSFS